MRYGRKTSLPLALTFLFAFSIISASCEPQEEILEPDPSPAERLLTIDPEIEGIEPTWLLSMPDGTLLHGTGDSLLTGAPLGEYEILWEPVERWHSPRLNPENRTLTKYSDETLAGSYKRIQGDMGDIVVQPQPKELRPKWNLKGPDGFFTSAKGFRNLKHRAVGQYNIVWGSVEGFVAPPPSSFDLTKDATVELTVDYVPESVATGTIVIDPNPDAVNPSWTLESDSGESYEGSGDQTLADMPTGEYTITWALVEGFVTPPPATSVLGPDATLEFTANYDPASPATGTLVIDPNPDSLSAPWRLDSGTGAITTGQGDQTLLGMPTGEYTITWQSVEGFVTPAPATSVLDPDATLNLTATYETVAPTTGTIVIDTTPDSLNAPWTLEAESGETYTGSGDQTLVDMPYGVYTLTWGDVEGYAPPSPNPVTQTLGTQTNGTLTIGQLTPESSSVPREESPTPKI